MSSREDIYGKIKDALKANPILEVKVEHNDHMIYDRDRLVDAYVEYQEANKGEVLLSSKETLKEDVSKLLADLKAERLLIAKNIESVLPADSIEFANKIVYDKSVEEQRSDLFNIDFSIIHADVGVANLGIIGIATNEENPRLASLIVSSCIILLKKESILPNLFEAINVLKGSRKDGHLPTNIVFILGPSRTADIELKTVLGVHGPRNVYVVLY
ncbi:lactate utilization protein C [Helicobacter sp. 13S00401-1]|uniref:LutC/YkgG family protein n=1 Tax=Helicobacter sp. 13S00401-1 TaxID=1905758 RepID=UPI000BA52073|nr:lactate utilization protein C [Helicobacter sp. 13S00401-1]PAF50241.1 lactate utilization protein C [Helicobacter sp. 13S00401-1]